MITSDDRNTIVINGIAFPLASGCRFSHFSYLDEPEYDFECDNGVTIWREDEMTTEIALKLLAEHPFLPCRVVKDGSFKLGWVHPHTDYALTVDFVKDDLVEDMWGDDWNDAPYEHNAEPVYDQYVDHSDQILLKPGWIYQDLCDFGDYKNGVFNYTKHRNPYGSNTEVSIEDMKNDPEMIYGRIVNTRTGDEVLLHLSHTDKKELYDELTKVGAI